MMMNGMNRAIVATLFCLCLLMTLGLYLACPDPWVEQMSGLTSPPRYRRASYRPGVTLAAHLSVARLQMLRELFAFWPGPIAASVVCHHRRDVDKLLAMVGALSVEEQRRFAFSYWEQPSFGTDFSYPANFLRNKALEQVATRFALLVDIDFVPSANLYAALLRATEALPATATSSSPRLIALAIAAFEVGPDTPRQLLAQVVGSKAGLMAAIAAGKAKPVLQEDVLPRSVVEYNPSHYMFFDYERWYNATEPYQRPILRWDHEPYLVVPLDEPCLPAYDERFFYRGNDKFEYTQHLHALDFSFLVLPNEYIVHLWHPAAAWNADSASKIRSQRVDSLLFAAMKERGQLFNKEDLHGFNAPQRARHKAAICDGAVAVEPFG